MKEYHKIQTVFHRSPESNYKQLMEGVFALPEFELLKEIEWTWTEKIDGTNIRIFWDGETVRFGGKTDNAHIPTFLLQVLQDTFTAEKMRGVFGEAVVPEGHTNAEPLRICLYGEGYGAKIQKGGSYIPDRTDFILFDVKVNDWWLTRESIEDIASKLGVKIVPVIGKGKLLGAVEFVKQGYKSTISHNKEYIAEGLIMKPSVELFNRKGERIISKIKYKDFPR
ncbi:MAG: RNA ligase family protein [Bacteroidota bacterium]